jgi:dTDP-4-dehydrorhamnose 3,5-epimerase
METKLVSCLRGRVFDVAVDLRRNSPTFLHWHGEELSAGNHKSMLIPAGFAHGLQTLENHCELLYFHSAAYAAEAEDGIHPQEPKIGIDWPLPIVEMSTRDRGHPALSAEFRGLAL